MGGKPADLDQNETNKGEEDEEESDPAFLNLAPEHVVLAL